MKKTLVALLLATALSAARWSKPIGHQEAGGSYILPGIVSDVVYSGDLTLDAYAPAGEPRPAAIIIHGHQGSKITHVTQLFEPLARAGYAWFSVDYRNSGDVAEAARFVGSPGRFNVTSKLILIGEDTGARIALEVAATGGFAGVITFGAKLEGTTLFPGVPVRMIQGTNDAEAPSAQAEGFCKKLKNCEFYPVEGGIHNFENWHPDQWHWKEKLAAWLRDDPHGLWKDVVYARPGGRAPLMDAFIPRSGPNARGSIPVVIIVHGGGWEAGDKVTYVSPIFELLARAGFAWFSIDYRLTPYVRNPDQLEDLRTAIRYVRQHAARFLVDPNRIAILGESASGQMVTQVASEPCAGCEVQAVVSFYGVYDFTHWPEIAGRRSQLDRLFGEWTAETLKRYSPIFHAHAHMPPVLIIQGTNEQLYQPALEYAARLKQVGAHYDLLLLPGAPHGMENWEGHPEWTHYRQKLVDWPRATLH